MTSEMLTNVVANDVLEELERAEAAFPKFASAHEGYAILLEEVEELKAEVFWGPTLGKARIPQDEPMADARMRKMRAEAVQVAAMALRFIKDCC